MATTTLRPTSTILDDSFDIVGGTGTVHGVLSDDDDASFVGLAATGLGDNVQVGLTDITIAAGSVTKEVRVRLQTSMYALNPASRIRAVLSIGGETPSGSATINWGDATEHTIIIKAQGYTDAEVDAATLEIAWDGGQGTIRVHEAYVDVITVPKPTVNVTTPTGTVDDDTTPGVGWIVDFDEAGGVPTHQEVKIFDEATYSAGGFDPDVDTPVTESGVEELMPVPYFSGDYISGWIPISPLSDGNYRSYAREAQTVNGELHWSDWNFEAFSVEVYRPRPPVLTLTPEDDNGRILAEIAENDTARTNLITNPKLGTATTNWSNVSLTTFERVTSLPAGGPSGVTTGLHIIGNANADRATISMTTVAGQTYRLSLYVRLHSLSATQFTAVPTNGFVPLGSGIILDSGDVGTTLRRYDVEFTADGTTVVLWLMQVGAGAMEVTATCFLVELDWAGEVLKYFDGDSYLSSWTGTDELSTSTQIITTTVFYLEKSIDGGGTWSDVRTGHASGLPLVENSGGNGSVYDYEASNGVSTMYRAQSLHFFDLTELSGSAYDIESAMWESEDWWLKHPTNPTLNRVMKLRSLPSIHRELRASPHYVFNREHPIVVSDTPQGPEGDVVFFGMSDGGREGLVDLLADAVPLLLQAPNNMHVRWPDRWVAFTSTHDSERQIDSAIARDTWEALHWVEVERPDGPVETESGDPLLIGGM